MAMTAGVRLAAGGGAAAVLVALGVALLGSSVSKEPEVADEVTASVAPAPAAGSDTATPLPPEAPRFDVVRADAAGITTIAGTAAPGAGVSLRLDGVEIARLAADRTGQFAGLVTLPPSDAPRVLSLVMVLPDGAEVAGKETVVLAPMPAVGVVADAAPEATATTPAADAPAVAEAPAALLVKPEGVEVLQAANDAPVAAVQIDSIAYAPDGAVLLGGRGGAGAVVRLYLDDAPVQDVTVASAGTWQATLGEVTAGLHRLRADQVDASGKVTARFETPFKREPVEALAALVATEEPQAPATEVAAADTPAVEAESTVAPVAETPTPAASAAEPAPDAPLAEAAPATPAAPVTVTVQPGFTLWGIAESTFGDGVLYVQVFEANKDKIKNPDLIYPGQIFTVPAP